MIEEIEALAPFRRDVREWCAEHVPKQWRETQRGVESDEHVAFQRWWHHELRDAGYLAPHWPAEWGGGGYDLARQVVLFEELARADVPRLGLYQVALYNAGPGILHAGSNEQKRRFLPGILDGDVWCQGFSEPNAGSDLASLRTRAERDGDSYVVNGQKVWTSAARVADWCILLARTDPSAPKRKGITYLVVDMHSPGVEVRPIRQATGAAEFCETFLTDVVVPVENRLGPENQGWQVAQGTLASERSAVIVELVERLRRNGRDAILADVAGWVLEDGTPALEDPGVQEELAAVYAEVEIVRLLVNRMVTNLIRRGGVGPEASVTKIFYSEILQRMMDLAARLEGLPGQTARPLLLPGGWETGNWLLDYVNSFGWTIGGGTNEILRNMVGERVLGLPRDPTVEKDA